MSTAAALPKHSVPEAPVVDLRLIYPSPTNPRKTFDPAQQAELVDSVKKRGVLQPVLVRPNPKGDVPYELVAGERRYRAAKEAGFEVIPAVIRQLEDAEVIEIQLEENLRRTDLTPLEEAEGYHALMGTAKGYSVDKIAERFGRTVTYIQDRLRLLALTKDAKDLLRAGRIQLGHAVLLARLKPARQAEAIDPRRRDALWEHEYTLLSDDEEEDADKARKKDRFFGLKARTARELQAWIDKHVRFDAAAAAQELPDLFGETQETIAAAREEREKIVPITTDHYVLPEAKDGAGRTYARTSWKRADGKWGSKKCPHAITGVIVVGAGRGEAFKVCIAKKVCVTHWSAEIRAAKKRASGVAASPTKDGESAWEAQQRRYREQEQKRKVLRDRWAKALPAILEALVDTFTKMPVAGAAAVIRKHFDDELCCAEAAAARHLPLGKSAEDMLKHLAFRVVMARAEDPYDVDDCTEQLNALGVDAERILNERAPEEKKAPAKPAAKASKKTKTSKRK